MLVKMLIAIDIDPEEYPIPADGKVSEEIEETWWPQTHGWR